jgi:hypothetical protein
MGDDLPPVSRNLQQHLQREARDAGMNLGGRVLLKATRPYPTRVLRRSSLRFDLHDADRSAEDHRTTSSGIISTLDERNGDASLPRKMDGKLDTLQTGR